MISMIDPGVFWTDILLSATTLTCGLLLLKKTRWGSVVFLALAVSTAAGAFYHGYFNTTAMVLGELLWTCTMLALAIAAIALLRLSFPRLHLGYLVGLFVVFTVFNVFIDESFKWGLVLQAISILGYIGSLFRRYLQERSRRDKDTLMLSCFFLIVMIVAVYIQQSGLTFGTTLHHNTIFHLVEVPAIILLYLSINVTYEQG